MARFALTRAERATRKAHRARHAAQTLRIVEKSSLMYVVEIRTRPATTEDWGDWRPCDHASTLALARALKRMRYDNETRQYRIAIYSRQSVID